MSFFGLNRDGPAVVFCEHEFHGEGSTCSLCGVDEVAMLTLEIERLRDALRLISDPFCPLGYAKELALKALGGE